MTTTSLIPIPPTGVPVFNGQSGQIDILWQNYFNELNALGQGIPPIDAEYWVSTSDTDLTNERNIGALATGYLKITSAIGVATPSSVSAIPSSDVAVTWATNTFVAGNFTGNALMTWTLTAPDQVTYRYASIGKLATITLDLQDTTVGGTPDTTLQVALPSGIVASKAQGWTFWFDDDGIKGLGKASVTASGTALVFEKANKTLWTATTNATDIQFTGTLEMV